MIDDESPPLLWTRPRPRPWTVPCLITTSSFTIFAEGIPGAAASVSVLDRDYGLSAHWKPIGVFAETPYAFVALGLFVHVAWFASRKYVATHTPTACGLWFDQRARPLLSQPKSHDTNGPCADCLTAWGDHYGQ
ncbi:hypothetical protein SAMN04487819_107297 [Actinopolyspora alba]|uniref:Uncharacterized protein n=1 Tax=Actinopolyspora alba TaxID=673379 RepID=A0A1I1XTE1_9ACTN|nr:hypothetical protein [Actinopolyspora alba]SFE08870.1 hypothetical protein SAMN04487819_107297 [Actinopolyspora alba]